MAKIFRMLFIENLTASSASEVTTLWRYTNLFTIIIIVIINQLVEEKRPRGQSSTCRQSVLKWHQSNKHF